MPAVYQRAVCLDVFITTEAVCLFNLSLSIDLAYEDHSAVACPMFDDALSQVLCKQRCIFDAS